MRSAYVPFLNIDELVIDVSATVIDWPILSGDAEPMNAPRRNTPLTPTSTDRFAFRPNSTSIVVVVSMIVTAVACGILLNAGGLLMAVILTTSSVLSAVGLVISDRHRGENAGNLDEKERDSAKQSTSRYLKLRSDSMRTNSVLSHMTD